MVEPIRTSNPGIGRRRIAAVVRPTLRRAVLWCLHPAASAGERSARSSPSPTFLPTPPPSPAPASGPPFEPQPEPQPEPSSEPTRPQITVRMLGPFELTVDGIAVVDWHGRLGPLVLRYLLAQPGHRCSRDMLLEQFWPYADPAKARNRLHVAISSLRRVMKAHGDVPIIEHHAGWYRISPAVDVSLDTDELDRLVDDAERARRRGDTARALDTLRAAVDLYRGEYLADLRYEEWAMPEREAYRAGHVQALDRIAALAEEQHRFDDAIDAANRLVRADPSREDAHRVLMRCHAERRRLGDVVRQFETCRTSLAAIGVSPSPETIELYRRLRRGLSLGCELSPTG